MGNIFSGDGEALLLYFVCPGIGFIALLSLTRALLGVATKLRETTSWERRGLDSDEASLRYRSAAARTENGAPIAVQRVAYSLVLWAFGNAGIWLLVSVMAALLEQYWVCLAAPLCLLACYQVTECAFALTDREGAEVHKHIQRARAWVLLHHTLWFLIGTTLVVLLMISITYFWNGPDEQMRRRAPFLGAYLLFVILPTGGAFLLQRALKRVASLYPTRAKESPQAAT